MIYQQVCFFRSLHIVYYLFFGIDLRTAKNISSSKRPSLAIIISTLINVIDFFFQAPPLRGAHLTIQQSWSEQSRLTYSDKGFKPVTCHRLSHQSLSWSRYLQVANITLYIRTNLVAKWFCEPSVMSPMILHRKVTCIFSDLDHGEKRDLR